MEPAQSVWFSEAKEVSDDVKLLVGELDAHLHSLYPKEQSHGLSVDAIFSEKRVRFFVAKVGDEVVGCGAVRLAEGKDEFVEVKRMFVRPAWRCKGVARKILTHLAAVARESGAHVLMLETGAKQHDAIKLYNNFGFESCKVFGDYKVEIFFGFRSSLTLF
jgi:putative acetyltransferase